MSHVKIFLVGIAFWSLAAMLAIVAFKWPMLIGVLAAVGVAYGSGLLLMGL